MTAVRPCRLSAGWCYGGVADTAYNSVVVHQGLISNNVYGGFADGYQTARSTSNTVFQTGGDVSHVVGGHADSGRGKALADSNLVIIEGGTAGTVVGGYASGLLDGSARYNLVSISAAPLPASSAAMPRPPKGRPMQVSTPFLSTAVVSAAMSSAGLSTGAA